MSDVGYGYLSVVRGQQSVVLFGRRKPGPSPHSGIFDGLGQVSVALPVDMSGGFGVLEQVDCGFGNADCGIEIEFLIYILFFFNPKSEIRNPK